MIGQDKTGRKLFEIARDFSIILEMEKIEFTDYRKLKVQKKLVDIKKLERNKKFTEEYGRAVDQYLGLDIDS